MPTITQWIHVAQLVLAAAVVIAGIYNQMQLATALGVLVGLSGSVGIYLGGTPSPPQSKTGDLNL